MKSLFCRTPLLSAMVAAAALITSALPTFAQTLPEAGWLADETAREYRSRARFPAHAAALSAADEDPILAKRVPSRTTVPARQEGGVSLTVWPAEVAFLLPRPAIVHARMTDALGRGAGGSVRGEVIDEEGLSRAKLAFFDDGVGADARAGDGIYTAVHKPSKTAPRVRAESLMVRVSAIADGQLETVYATTGFLFSRPGAMLTGRYRDGARGGDLVLGAEVRAKLAGRYHLKATITAADGTPIGIAQTAQHLEPGDHWLELGFFGLMFHQRGLPGPYRIGTITLTDATGIPNALGAVVRGAHTTRSYRLGRFSSATFGDRDLLEAARRLEAESARSRHHR